MLKFVTVTVILLHLFASIGHSQKVDYADIRDSVRTIACGAPDTADVNQSLRNLTSLDTTLIEKNIHMYYEDLGMCYWMFTNGENGQIYIRLAIEANHKALYHKPKSTKALWNLSVAYFIMGDCLNGKLYMEKYKQYAKKKYWDEEQEKGLLERCEFE